MSRASLLRWAIVVLLAAVLGLSRLLDWRDLSLCLTGLLAALIACSPRPNRGRLAGLAGMLLLLGLMWWSPALEAVTLAVLPVLGNLAVAWRFGSSLRPGQVPLIARFIAVDFGRARPELDGYARLQTWVWSVVPAGFGLLHAVVLVAEGQGSRMLMQWNIGLMLLLFVAEHGLRRLRYPELGPASPLRTFRVIASVMGPGGGR